eukprot:2090075-Rhodomonas_salina.3
MHPALPRCSTHFRLLAPSPHLLLTAGKLTEVMVMVIVTAVASFLPSDRSSANAIAFTLASSSSSTQPARFKPHKLSANNDINTVRWRCEEEEGSGGARTGGLRCSPVGGVRRSSVSPVNGDSVIGVLPTPGKQRESRAHKSVSAARRIVARATGAKSRALPPTTSPLHPGFPTPAKQSFHLAA